LGRDVEIHQSARKHGVTDDDIEHAIAHPLVVADLDDENSPARTLVLGPNITGNLLEVIVLHFDDGRDMAIHAMAMRNRYRAMLPRPEEPQP
jgi:hypothetical protein